MYPCAQRVLPYENSAIGLTLVHNYRHPPISQPVLPQYENSTTGLTLIHNDQNPRTSQPVLP